MGQRVCSPLCAGRLVKADKKRERAQDKVKREEQKSLPKLIASAQIAFNAFIRERDKDKVCFVCLRPFDQNIPGRALHAGHVRSRGAAGHLRFVEDNCMGECEGCNGPHGAKPHQIKAGAIARIGADRFAELENDNAPHKWTKDEVRGIRDTYKRKLKELKA
jgi:5-methylcytosine-specific restriction endonuclease McrA